MNQFRKLFAPSIRRRITFSYLIVILFVLAMAVVSYFQLSQVKPYSDAIIEYGQDQIQLQKLASAASALDADLERFLVIHGVEYKESVQTDLQEITEAYAALKTNQASELLSDYSVLEEMVIQLQVGVQDVLVAQEEGASSGEITKRIVTVYDNIDQIQQMQKDLSAKTLSWQQASAQTQSQIASNVLTNFVILGSVVLLSVVLASWTTDRRLRSISSLTQTATEIAAGDLTREAPVERLDEIGTLAKTFNAMTFQLRELIGNLEQRVADRTKALSTSAEVSRHLTSIIDPRNLVSEVVNEIHDAFEYYYTQIYLLDDARQNLVLAGGTGEAGVAMLARGHSLPIGLGLVGSAAESNKPVLVSDTLQSPDWLPNDLLPETKTEAAVPISIGDRVLGVLDVQHNLVNGLNLEDVTLLESIAGQVAITLQNARMFEESRKQAEFESLVNIIGQKIQRATSMEDTLQTAIRELGTAIGASRVRAVLQPDSVDSQPLFSSVEKTEESFVPAIEGNDGSFSAESKVLD